MKNNFKCLLQNLCCSNCKTEFTEESFILKDNQNDIKIMNLVCKNCGKDFGTVMLNINKENIEPLTIKNGYEPINYDDVIDAHKFIKNLDKNWQNYIPKLK